MNPFKIKQLEEFTESDCNAYLDRYPYGEHYVEVSKRLKDIRSGKIKTDSLEEEDSVLTSHKKRKENSKAYVVESKVNESKDTDDNEDNSESDDINNDSYSSIDTNHDNDSMLDKLFSIIGVIVAGAIFIVIILCVVDAFMSDDLAGFLQKHKGPIYAALRSLFNVLKHIR